MVSVIVPVYNAEAYLDTCIKSIVEQTYNDIELILVDDCSTDRSLEICRKWSKEDSRVIVHKMEKNSGPSSARNLGLSLMRGNWYMFVDADDWIDRQCIEVALDYAESKNVDVVLWNLVQHIGENNTVVKPLCGEERIFKGYDIQKLIDMILTYKTETGDNRLPVVSPCCKLFKSNSFKNIEFPTSINLGEDACYILQILNASSKTAYINYNFYYRRLLNDSLSQKCDIMFPERLESYMNWEYKFCSERNLFSNNLDDFFMAKIQEVIEKCIHVFPDRNQRIFYKKINRFIDNMGYKIDYASLQEQNKVKIFLISNRYFWLYKTYFVIKNIMKRNL